VIPITINSRVGIGLILLAGGRPMEYMRTHGVAEDTAFRIFDQFLDSVNSCPQLNIKFDLSENSLRKTAAGFQNLSQVKLFDSCVGAIDGLSIRECTNGC